MSSIPKNLRYTETHEWARLEADGTVTIGITDYAQHQMGEIVMVELPRKGHQAARGASLGALEAVKTASDYYSPVDGTVEDANTKLESDPGLVNTDCYGAGWLAVVKPSDPSQLDSLMDASGYARHTGE
ncbi:glycine cleavage system protein GcvH [Candidatus Fermentibacteria bacterium]|nr:glycine cleavage system protein GcvH [Candidatus Fermentibacteria bacterium]